MRGRPAPGPGGRARSRPAFAALLLLAACASPPPPPDLGRVTDSETGISIVVPGGWQPAADPHLPRVKFAGPPVDGFAPKLSLSSLRSSAPLDEIARRTLADLRAQHDSYFERSRAPFRTDGGVEGLRLEVEGKPFGRLLRSRIYLLAREDRRYSIAFTRLATPDERSDASFDESVRSLDLPNR